MTTLAKYGDDSVYTLGSTGDTIIYIFPNGEACLERHGQSTASNLPATPIDVLKSQSSSGSATSPDDLEQLILGSGLITTAQYSVASYDTATTGLSLIEVLQTRGWINPSDVTRLLGKAAR